MFHVDSDHLLRGLVAIFGCGIPNLNHFGFSTRKTILAVKLFVATSSNFQQRWRSAPISLIQCLQIFTRANPIFSITPFKPIHGKWDVLEIVLKKMVKQKGVKNLKSNQEVKTYGSLFCKKSVFFEGEKTCEKRQELWKFCFTYFNTLYIIFCFLSLVLKRNDAFIVQNCYKTRKFFLIQFWI